MATSETNIHDVRGIYWDRSEDVLHLHIVTGTSDVFDFNLFHDKDRQPEVIQATVTGRYNPAGKMAAAAAERCKGSREALGRLKKALDTGAKP